MSKGEIVVIDDSYLILDRIRARLQGEGYQVHITIGAAAATLLIRTADLAIIDFHMPGLDGGQMLARLKSSAAPGNACLYYLYTSDRSVATRYREYGFDGAFLRKGEEALLGPQVHAVFRTIGMRKLAKKLRDDRQP
jgi:CheY-like chemotaxis protein